MISIIHPSRGRPYKSWATISNWLNRASNANDIEVVISVDLDDPNLLTYKDLYHKFEVIVSDNRHAVDAINMGALRSLENILIVVSDDTDCPENWDDLLLKEVEGKTDWILKTQDGIQKWIITMPVMDRAYYNRFGYIYYPSYEHMFCDTELSCVADLTGRRLESKLMFEHLHYSTGKSVKDAISDKADKTWDQGEKLFLERYQRNFDLKETPGRITSPEYLSWIKRKIK